MRNRKYGWACGRPPRPGARHIKKTLSVAGEGLFLCGSGWQDSNLRPRRPERRALPGCATPRKPADGATGFLFPIVSGRKKPPNPRVRRLLRERLLFRRSGRIRTYDLQHPMLARYQATLHPVWYWSDKGKVLFDSRASQRQIKFSAPSFLIGRCYLPCSARD
jgi:hypothetical protein